ncbi:hypothetical protein LWI28_022062 [Acer negundo]|uniref:Uncharacterized protein n=1 Tax=Acer negundo TaxID=4023 RepID=A0AAD5P3L8_ACENE|nr:hypothetical protein LWI28_022062 [Acer negundo]
MGGGMEANKNRFIEEWGSARENLEHNFRWTRRNFALIGIFGIAIPIFVYKGIVKEFHMQDEDAGRPYRNGSIGWFVKNIKKKTDTSLVLYLAVSITDSAEMGMHAEQEASVTSCIVDREIFSLKNGVCRIED